MLTGYKTYIVGGLAVATGVALLLFAEDKARAMEMIYFGLGIMGLRAGVEKLR